MRQNWDFEHQPWFLVPVRPGADRRAKKMNVWMISALIFIVIGVFVMTTTPEIGHAAASGMHHLALSMHKVPLKIDENPTPVDLSMLKNGYSSVIDPALPGVVNVSSTKVVKQQNNIPGFFFNDPMFRQFFGNNGPDQMPNQPQTEREHSLGSGVIVNPDGYILTNNHVIEGATDIEVFTQDKKKFRAKLVGTDPRTDVAVLKIDATDLPSLTLGDSSKLKVGDVVFAIGNPFSVGETATMGIVSATGRGFGGAIEHYEDFIQTDAAINPGNSGGALLDLHGDLIGINTAILTGGGGSGGNQGIGFAIPINMARNVMEQIVDHGKVVRGQLGVAVQNVDADMAKAFGLAQGGGALVAEVTPGSPAAKAGIERGDIILQLNGQPVNEPDDLSVRISETAPGTTVQLKIARNGQTRDVSVTLSEMSEKAEASAGQETGNVTLQGVQVQNLTPSMTQELGIPSNTQGVVITSLDSSSAAAAAGLQSGDVIQEVNRKPVRNVQEYREAVSQTHGQSILLLVNRGGATHFIVVEPQ
jgi:serine protease Do